MDDIDTGYLLELQFLAEASIDIQFQAWMALSFAVIVAAYSGRGALTRSVRMAVSAIYLLVCYALFARWMTEAARLNVIQSVLGERGLDVVPILLAPEARYLACALGTLITVTAVFYFRRTGDDGRP